MKEVKVDLGSMKKVQDFVKKTGTLDFDVDLTSDRYTVDGKSLMGIYSLDLTKPIEAKLYSEGPMLEKGLETIKEFIVED